MKIILVLLLFASSLSAQSVRLLWDAPIDVTAVHGFNVYRSQSAGQYSGTPLNTSPIPLNQSTFDDTGVAYGQSYFYTVKSVHVITGGADILSIPSNEINVVVPSSQPTPIPAITRADCTTGNGRRIDSAWTIQAPATASNFTAQYTNETNPANFILKLDATAALTAVLTVQAGREVTISVQAVGPGGLSAPVAVRRTCIAAPQNLRK